MPQACLSPCQSLYLFSSQYPSIMGNCLRIDRDVSQKEMEAIKTLQELTTSRLKMKRYFVSGKWKKKTTTARFRVRHVEAKAGVLRIKAVVTRRELNQILKYKKDTNYSSLDHLMTVMKLRRPQLRMNDKDDGVNGNRRPALKSIPEEHGSGSCI